MCFPYLAFKIKLEVKNWMLRSILLFSNLACYICMSNIYALGQKLRATVLLSKYALIPLFHESSFMIKF